MLGDAGYEIVATVDDLDEALESSSARSRSDPQRRPPAQTTQTGIELAHRAKERGVPTLFATGHAYPGASESRSGA